MRRPLCYLCMAFVAAVFIMLKIRPMQEHALQEGTEGSEVTWQGKVTAKEYKNESLILYLYKENGEGFLCYMEDNREPRLGSTIMVTGKVQNFKQASNPGGFDQGEYYRLQKIYCQMRHGRILAESQEYDIWREKLYQLRRHMERILESYMDEKDASIMKAMLLGNKTELDRDSKQLYQKSGIAHVLAISGVKTLKLDIPLVPETRINWAFMPLHIVIIYILKLCLDEEIIPRCRFPCSRGYFTKCINWQKKQ